MAKAIVNPQRFDPYKNFRFRGTIDGITVATLNDATGLNPTPGSPQKKSRKKMPGLQKFGNITLKRVAITDTKFLDWINDLFNLSETEAKNLRKTMILEYCNEAGEVIASYRLINGWVTKLEGPDLNAKGNEVVIETIELGYEGLELIKS